MANQITLASNFTALLDEAYRAASVTGDLNTNDATILAAANAGEVKVPKMTVDGLADYSRNGGYTNGSVALEWETVKYNYDRGRIFEVDSMDNQESVNLAFGQLGGQLMKNAVAPEADAFTFATLAGLDNILTTDGADLATGETILEAIRAAENAMDAEEVDTGRILYIAPALYRAVQAMDSYKSQQVLADFSKIQLVPVKRFYTAIDMQDGKTSGEEAGGYKKAEGGVGINFMIIEPTAILKADKHIASDIIDRAQNQHADAYMLKYRKYGLVSAYENKRSGIYLHKATK